MEGIIHADDFVAATVQPAPLASEFDHAFIRLGTGIAEKATSAKGMFGDFLRQNRCVFVDVVIGAMDEFRRLLGNDFRQSRMTMP